MTKPVQDTENQIQISQAKSVLNSLRALLVIMGVIQLLLGSSCKKDIVEIETESGLQCVVSDLQFGEGPAYYNGYLHFSDIKANTIYRWNESSGKTIFRENSGGANGLYFSPQGNLIVCEGNNKRIVSIDPFQKVTVTTDSFGGKSYNEPNDLWISPSGNIYFTDPVFTGTQTQDGLNVYCVLAATGSVTKVVSDLVKPNGIIGNSAGKLLYIADYGASKIYKYTISSDGSLGNKQLFITTHTGLYIEKLGLTL